MRELIVATVGAMSLIALGLVSMQADNRSDSSIETMSADRSAAGTTSGFAN